LLSRDPLANERGAILECDADRFAAQEKADSVMIDECYISY